MGVWPSLHGDPSPNQPSPSSSPQGSLRTGEFSLGLQKAATSTSEGSSELCAKAGHEGMAVGDIHEVSLFGPSLRGPLRAYVCQLLHITTLLCIWLRYLLEQTFHTTLSSLQNLGLSLASEIQNGVFLTPSGCFNTASHLPPWPQRSFCLGASKIHGNPPASDSQVLGSKACISSQPVTGYFY